MNSELIHTVKKHFEELFPYWTLYYQYKPLSDTLFFVVDSDELYNSAEFMRFRVFVSAESEQYEDRFESCVVGPDRLSRLDDLTLLYKPAIENLLSSVKTPFGDKINMRTINLGSLQNLSSNKLCVAA